MAGRSEHFADGAAEHYRNATPVSPENFGMKVVPQHELPKEVLAHHWMLGPNNDKHGVLWTGTKTETISPSTPIHTGQHAVGREHVDRYASRLKTGAKTPVDFKDKNATEEDQDNGRPRLLRHEGALWHVDGLHRIAAAREKGRSVKARVYDIDGEEAKPQYRAPAGHWGTIDHLMIDHAHDNDVVDHDTDMAPHEVHEYHQELHNTLVADHRHS